MRDGLLAEDEFFCAEQNARVVKAAEHYYRTMFGGRASTWNQRDLHMTDTLDALIEHLGREPAEPAKIVVWAHNSHLGDARATETRPRGELNVGQLVRERHGGDCRSSASPPTPARSPPPTSGAARPTASGCAPATAAASRSCSTRPASRTFLLCCDERAPADRRDDQAAAGAGDRGHLPPGDRAASHYFHARPGDQFDAVIHLDRTRALTPLEPTAEWEAGEEPETYPTGL